jgi:hypothetical protein
MWAVVGVCATTGWGETARLVLVLVVVGVIGVCGIWMAGR